VQAGLRLQMPIQRVGIADQIGICGIESVIELRIHGRPISQRFFLELYFPSRL
jgi:hypothetical protein